MRLEESEILAISELARIHFGMDVRVFLFGSRTDDLKKGGDIDLLISKEDVKRLTVKTKIDFLADLMIRLENRKLMLYMKIEQGRACFNPFNPIKYNYARRRIKRQDK